MTELELRQMFKNLSDCYAETGRFENDGSYTWGDVIQAMTEDRFIEALKEAKLLDVPIVSNSVYCNCDNPTKYTDANEKTYCKWCGKDFKQ